MGAEQGVAAPPCGAMLNVHPVLVMTTPECGVLARMAADVEGARTDA
jgi:hypothetical protein